VSESNQLHEHSSFLGRDDAVRKALATIQPIVFVFLLAACSQQGSYTAGSQSEAGEIASWPYPYVKIENRVYAIDLDEPGEVVAKEQIGEQIGIVEKKYEYEGEEGTSQANIVSNHLEEGTKLFAIKGLDPHVSIAIETGENRYEKAQQASDQANE
jgi:hypothetical protein